MRWMGIIWNLAIGEGDTFIEDGRIAAGDPLVASAFVLLFTRRALPSTPPGDELPPVPHGWWPTGIDNEVIGSRLWTLEGAKNTTANRRLAQLYAREALQPWIDEGVARSVTIEVADRGQDRVDLGIRAIRPDGTRWEYVWREALFDGL